MLQFGGFAIMPFALLVLSGYGEAVDAPLWIGPSSAALAFLLAGLPAFGLIVVSAPPHQMSDTFVLGMLTATMRSAPREQVGLALGALGRDAGHRCSEAIGWPTLRTKPRSSSVFSRGRLFFGNGVRTGRNAKSAISGGGLMLSRILGWSAVSRRCSQASAQPPHHGDGGAKSEDRREGPKPLLPYRREAAPLVERPCPRVAVDHIEPHPVVAVIERPPRDRFEERRAHAATPGLWRHADAVQDQVSPIDPPLQRGHEGRAPGRTEQAVDRRHVAEPAAYESALGCPKPDQPEQRAVGVPRTEDICRVRHPDDQGSGLCLGAEHAAQLDAKRFPVERGDPGPLVLVEAEGDDHNPKLPKGR